jgi:hypothetical protein
MARNDDQDRRNVGYINLTWNDNDKIWSVGGNYTDHLGKEWDLGYCKVGTQGLQGAIELVGKQVGPTLAGKGIPRQERKGNGNNNRSGGPKGPE